MSTNRKIKLLIVEDSPAQREMLMHILLSTEDFEIIGLADNGLKAINALHGLKPDVVLMDLHMPVMNGIDAIRYIMTTNPMPIIAMSINTNLDEAVNSFNALEAGALAFTEKPGSLHDPRYQHLSSYLIKTIKMMSGITVPRRRSFFAKLPQTANEPLKQAPETLAQDISLIAIGVSTGGPVVLKSILSLLPQDFPPILIVQHIAPGFIDGLAEWLRLMTQRPINIARHLDVPLRGHVYLAPDHNQMGLTKDGRISLTPGPLNNEICPSIDFLFNSVATIVKDKAMGILLTGMGSDGSRQLKHMREEGAITLAQDQESSMIFGMPGEAVKLGAARYVLSPDEIAAKIASFSRGVK